MTGWHQGPLCGFALRARGSGPEAARIYSAAVVLWNGAGITEQFTVPVIPGARVMAARAVRDISGRLARAMALRVPVVTWNAAFALTVLDRETRRFGCQPFAEVLGGYAGIIDPLVLDRFTDPLRRGSRTLASACERYEVQPADATEPAASALCAMRVAWKIGRAFPALAGLSPSALRDLQVKAASDQAASFQDHLRRQGSAKVIDGSWPLRAWAAPAAEVA